MSSETHRISKSVLTSLSDGIVELTSDWRAIRSPSLSLEGSLDGHLNLERLPASDFVWESRYFVDGEGEAVFAFAPSEYPYVDYDDVDVYVVGPFNGWQEGVGNARWKLRRQSIDNREAMVLRCSMEAIGSKTTPFKFVTSKHVWLPVDAESPNAVHDGAGNSNYIFKEKLSGRHRFRFKLKNPVDLSEDRYLIYHGRTHSQRAYIEPGPFFHQLKSDKPLGAIVEGDTTVFRLFAPRAKWVKLGIFGRDEDESAIRWMLLERAEDFVWETRIHENLDGHFYWYRLDGPQGPCSLFDPKFNALDPYAKAAASRAGPGIVVDEGRFESSEGFGVPAWQDLVIMEGHVRDLVAGLPSRADEEAPLGFADLEAYAASPDFYPARLGINALELQPVQENDSQTYQEYHWGYMTSNYFAPASSYGSDPRRASQVKEFRSLVERLHERGMAVILDVVYNHVGEPAHLMFIDKLYYFHLEADGTPVNWSGCGNDLRCDAPMARRLIVESLKHFVQFYGVDGFRFDLADLVGKPLLQEIERELKAIKPDVLLIAEPWSFRGHIGRDLRDTGYASWNDGYRDALKSFVQDGLSADAMLHYLKGSTPDYASWPSQTVNYTESHDDYVWIDDITENGEGNGTHPTLKDLKRTRLMGALLLMSIGMPMLHAGQDFLFSKGGVRNTYQRGDLNALSYARRHEYGSTSEYFRKWIAFRQSELGSLMRHFARAGKGFFESIGVSEGNAFACVYNADGSMGDRKLLFAANPGGEARRIALGKLTGRWRHWADRDRFWGDDEEALRQDVRDEIDLPPISCGLWVEEGSR
ncbi:MAG: hypothetical protein CBD18_08615 [Opitutales bacterium TMED158]|nr:MAG: hypothetical protein CBD18_08615 [Opitutales bacterium TMED158]